MRRIRPMRPGFTLLELMISIVIFSMITIYLYGTLDTLRRSNSAHGEQLGESAYHARIYKTLFLDLALCDRNQTSLISESRELDTLLTRTSHSVHRRIMPYVGYVVRHGTLYRFESYRPPETPLEVNDLMIVDRLVPVERFRVYSNKTHYLLDMKLKGKEEQLLKVPMLGH
jgi:prepilin-type N-terminal cleavage/methylation domain-containing protein